MALRPLGDTRSLDYSSYYGRLGLPVSTVRKSRTCVACNCPGAALHRASRVRCENMQSFFIVIIVK